MSNLKNSLNSQIDFFLIFILKNFEKFKFWKFQKIIIWEIPKYCNLENSNNF